MSSSHRTVYLFAGDSLTEGTYGESYVDRVAKALYQGHAGLVGEAINAGRSADTVDALLKRIDAPLERYAPHWVILAVGINDVWLPWLASHSVGWWLWLRYERMASGLVCTTDLDQFAARYRSLIDKVQRSGAEVLACTTEPVGENLSAPVNGQLARLNGVIKHVAAENQVLVADVWQAFVEELATLRKPSSYAPGEWLFTLMDRRRLASASVDEVSRRRRLHLTFDGVHLNSRGADLWSETILTTLVRAEGVAAASSQSPAHRLGLPSFERGPLQVCATAGWEARASDVAEIVAAAHARLAALTGVRPVVQVALLSQVHWNHVAPSLAYPRPSAWWEGGENAVLVPEAYNGQFLRDVHLPEAVASVELWPASLRDLEPMAQATALADLWAVEALARLFLRELQIAADDPTLDHLLAACLAEVALHTREGEEAVALAAAWDAWGEVLAEAGLREGQIRLQARALFEAHGERLATSIAERSQVVRDAESWSRPTVGREPGA